jgi:hypothetical protein
MTDAAGSTGVPGKRNAGVGETDSEKSPFRKEVADRLPNLDRPDVAVGNQRELIHDGCLHRERSKREQRYRPP